MAGVLINKSLAVRMKSATVRNENSAMRKTRSGSRRISGQVGNVVGSSITPFLASFENDTISITGGIITVYDCLNQTKQILVANNNTIDISDIESDTTLYIYLKVTTQWETNGVLNSYPAISLPEFYFIYNEVKFPATDEASYFMPIAKIEVTVTGNDPNYTRSGIITQLAFDNLSINGLDLSPFLIVEFNKAKLNDIDDDIQKTIYVNSGTAYLPDATPPMTSEKVTYTSGTIYIFAEITASIDSDGWLENYNSQLKIESSYPTTSDTLYYYKIGSYDGNLTQSIKTDINANARLF